jgi:GNAT superfamily N-acetyltransferase
MVGGARVVGDGVTFAWICDVFVVDDHRGLGLGKALMNAVVDHPAVAEVKRVTLATGDAHDLYTRYGFKALDNPERWMMRSGPII